MLPIFRSLETLLTFKTKNINDPYEKRLHLKNPLRSSAKGCAAFIAETDGTRISGLIPILILWLPLNRYRDWYRDSKELPIDTGTDTGTQERPQSIPGLIPRLPTALVRYRYWYRYLVPQYRQFRYWYWYQMHGSCCKRMSTSCTRPRIDHLVVDVGLVANSIMYFSWRFECHQD